MAWILINCQQSIYIWWMFTLNPQMAALCEPLRWYEETQGKSMILETGSRHQWVSVTSLWHWWLCQVEDSVYHMNTQPCWHTVDMRWVSKWHWVDTRWVFYICVTSWFGVTYVIHSIYSSCRRNTWLCRYLWKIQSKSIKYSQKHRWQILVNHIFI